MADNHPRNSHARTAQADPSYDVYDEDPLVELARIVSEDGGYFNIAEHPEPEALPDPELDIGYAGEEMDLGIDLEGRIMEELELSMAAPDGDYAEPDYAAQSGSRYADHAYAPEDSAALAQLSAGPAEQAVEYGAGPVAEDWPENVREEPYYAGDVPVELPTHQNAEADGIISVEDLSDLEQALSALDDNPPYDEHGLNGQIAADVRYDGEWPDGDAIDSSVVPPFVPIGEGVGRHDGSPEPRSGRKVFAIAAVLSIAVLGGGVVAMMNSTGNKTLNGAPPVFKADTNPVKVAPDAKDDVASEDAVFDVADGPVKEELVDRTETPVRQIIPAEETKQTEVLRPVGDESGKNSARISENAPIVASSPRYDPIGPKQVRTVKVGADGTIIRPSLDETGSTASVADNAMLGGSPTPVNVGASAAPAAEPKPVPVKVIDIKSGSANGDTIAADTKTSPLETVIASLPADETPLQNNASADAGIAGIPLPRERPAITPVVARAAPADNQLVAQPARVTQPNAAPVNLLEVARSPAPRNLAAAPASTGSTGASTGHLVQLSSQRTEEQARAAFNGLKGRYPSLLGNYNPNIQRADLGDRGVYYRVRVGPMSDQAAAVQFCEQLKSSGGSCFVTR